MKFFVGMARFKLDLPGCASLKDKRRVIRSITDRLGNSKIAGAAEVCEAEFWKSAEIGLACVSSSREVVVSVIDGAERMIEASGIEIVETEQWVLRPEDL